MLNLPGVHNVLNALAAIAVADGARACPTRRSSARSRSSTASAAASSATATSLDDGGGTFTLIDDYGHHPVEIAATLAAARGAFPGRRLVLAFQPHRYTRTRDCSRISRKVLGDADALVLADVYAAGETPHRGRRTARRSRARCACAARSSRSSSRRSPRCRPTLAQMLRAGDVVLTMGAGSIGAIAQTLPRALAVRAPVGVQK